VSALLLIFGIDKLLSPVRRRLTPQTEVSHAQAA
jgi:hypothetical protein